MALTKIRYDMLADEVTSTITQQVSLTGAGSPFVFTATNNGNTETLTKFKLNSVEKDIRSTSFNANNLLEIVLASFTPSIAASATPRSSLNWDEAATGFTAIVDNPTDYLGSYIDTVASIAALNGSSVYATLAGYSAGAKTATPAGGTDWNQTFTTGGSSYIRSASTTAAGGSASGRLSFTYNNGTSSVAYTEGTADFAVSWGTPVASITLALLTGNTFLQTYTGSTFTPSITNIANVAANCVYTVSATNATDPGVKAAGTHAISFTTPLHKTNAAATTTKVSLSAKITRPVGVADTDYFVTLTDDSDSVNATASFTYPSFYIWTAGTATVPTRDNCIDGSALDASTTVVTHDNQGKTFAGTINNTEATARAFWFAVRASASPPTTFKTGASVGLIGDYEGVVTATVGLAPDAGVKPEGYTDETYNLYGLVLQPGNTYVSIS